MIEPDFQFENKNQVSRYLGDTISAALITVLEPMQPGQSIELDIRMLKSESGYDQLGKTADNVLHESWHVIPTEEDNQREHLKKHITKNASPAPGSVTFMVSEINTTWSVCDKNSPFKLIKAHDLVKGHVEYQVFVFVMQGKGKGAGLNSWQVIR